MPITDSQSEQDFEDKHKKTTDSRNDDEYTQGCVAGGHNYLHINANGKIETCAFIHYADSNTHEEALLEACKSTLFMEYKKGQSFNENNLQPCPLLDNNSRLAEMEHLSGAQSTDLTASESADDLYARCKAESENWALIAEKIWLENNCSEIDLLD